METYNGKVVKLPVPHKRLTKGKPFDLLVTAKSPTEVQLSVDIDVDDGEDAVDLDTSTTGGGLSSGDSSSSSGDSSSENSFMYDHVEGDGLGIIGLLG